MSRNLIVLFFSDVYFQEMSAREPRRSRPAGLDAVVTTQDLAGLGSIYSMAVDADGTRFACTTSALHAFSPHRVKLLITGHKTETGFADGEDTNARFNLPCGIAVHGEGNVLVADTYNHALRKVTLRCGTVSTLAANREEGFADGISAAARFNLPWGIMVDAQGAIVVADSNNICLRQVFPGDGAVSTLAGDAEEHSGFADGQGKTARFNYPVGLALDTDSHIIVANKRNNCIRKVTTAEGRVTTVAGSAEAVEDIADTAAAAARFFHLLAVAVDCNNNILVADQGNNCIQMIAGTVNWVTTVAGSAEEKGKVGGTGASVRFMEPDGLALDEGGRLLLLDGNEGCVRVVEASLAPPQRLAPKMQPIKISLMQKMLVNNRKS